MNNKYFVQSLCHLYVLFWTMHFFCCLSHLFHQSVNKPKDWYKSMFKQIHKRPEGMCSLSLSLRNNEEIPLCYCPSHFTWSRKNKAKLWLRNFIPHFLNIVKPFTTYGTQWESAQSTHLKVEPDMLYWAWWDLGYTTLCLSFII